MQVKSTRPAESSRHGLQGSTRQYIISRLRRACSYAEQLLSLAEELRSTANHLEVSLEARAYYVGLCAAIDFEKRHWDQALQHYCEARFLYSYLARTRSSKQSEAFTDFISGNLDPNIRYAAYQLHLPRTTSIDTIVIKYVSQDTSDLIREVLKQDPEALNDPSKRANTDGVASAPKTIQWRSRTVKLEDAATAEALGAVMKAETRLSAYLDSNKDASSQAKAAEYDQLLIPSQDAVDATRTAIEELSVEGVPQTDPRMQALQVTRTAVNYALISWRIGRNRVLCGADDGMEFGSPVKHSIKTKDETGHQSHEDVATTMKSESTGRKIKKLRERIVLHDASLQSLNSVRGLPGVPADTSFLRELDSKQAYFSALRCLALARSHALYGRNKEALALLSRALEQASIASENEKTTDHDQQKPPNIDVHPRQARTLRALLDDLVLQYRALVELQNLDSSQSKSSITFARPLVETLHTYPANKQIDLTRLVNYPPKLEPIPVKPIFLDLAYNYIDYPGHGGRTTGLDGGDDADGSVNGTSEKAAFTNMTKDGKKDGGKKGWFGFGR